MFDIAWSELLVIGVIALIVLGPKDLPKALKLFTYWTRKARTMMHDFQGHVHEMVREAELDDVKRELEKATSPNLSNEIARAIDPSGSVENALKIDPAPPTPAVSPPAAPAAGEAAAPATPSGESQTRA